MCENATIQADGIWVRVYGRALADALQPVPRSGARMQPLNVTSHYYRDHRDVDRTRQMDCGASATLGPNRDVGGKQQRYHGGARGGDPTSAQKRELGQRPLGVLWGRLADGTGLVGVVGRRIMALYNLVQEVPRLQSRRGECIRFTERPRERRNKEQ